MIRLNLPTFGGGPKAPLGRFPSLQKGGLGPPPNTEPTNDRGTLNNQGLGESGPGPRKRGRIALARRSPCLTLGLMLMTLFLTGCAHRRTLNPESHLPPPIDSDRQGPGYASLVDHYNANCAGLNRLWSRNHVVVEWLSADKQYHKQGGEGKLIVVRDEPTMRISGKRPGVVLTLGALGHTLFWAGSNTQRYWLFDLRGKGKAYVGRFDQMDQLHLRHLPVPVQPSVVPYLLGLMPIDTDRGRGAMRTVHGYKEIQPKGSNIQYLMDPRTGLPVRITLLGQLGDPVLIAHLAHYKQVKRAGWAKERWPWLATKITLYPLNRRAKLSMHLTGMTDGRSQDKINPAVFNFNVLRQAKAPAKVIDLDKRKR